MARVTVSLALFVRRGLVAVSLCAALGFGPVVPGLRAQDPPAQGAQPQGKKPNVRIDSQDEGKIVRRVRLPDARSKETILRFLTTREGRPLSAAEVQADLQALWRSSKILVRAVFVEDAEEGGVNVVFLVDEPQSYDRTEFRGLKHFDEAEVREIIGLAVAKQITDRRAEELKSVLQERYWSEGYLYAHVHIKTDDELRILTLVVDEGPLVTIREVHFRGNSAFPGTAPLGLYTNLIGGAELEVSQAGKVLRGKAYSAEAVADDLERLRTFYRSHGYRDAEVELARTNFTPDLTEVDLGFRVIEGRRYRVRSVDIAYFRDLDATVPEPAPLYAKELLLEEIAIKPGDYYDRELINRDKRVIENFYGERGHPMVGRYGRAPLQKPFAWVRPAWMQPSERFDLDTAEIDLVFQIVEGTPKTVRDVRVRGNTDTLDSVVRRDVYIYPGDTLDLRKLEKSRRRLDALRYFQNPQNPVGVEFELREVPGAPDEVDIEITVEEGDTGSFLWGAGISTGAGVQGRFQFTKRNFDLTRLPSSWSPGVWLDEIIDNKAFHGAGQSLQLSLAPGTEISTFLLSLDDPDLFGDHIETIGGQVQGFRRIRILDSFDSDSLGAILQLRRNFTDTFQVAVQARQETVDVERVDGNAPTIVFDAEGQTELRTVLGRALVRDFDHFLRPSDGFEIKFDAEVGGGFLGAEEDFYKLGASAKYYYPLFRDQWDRAHVFHVRQSFDFGHAFSNTNDLFLTERWYMGGNNLRGFDQRDAGPTQFGRPVGGEVRYLSRLEYQFPLVSTRQGRAIREVELLRGVLFSDMGLLGTSIDDRTFRDLRMSVGIGIRIHVPILGLPIALDYGFPLLYEETDDRRALYFSLSP